MDKIEIVFLLASIIFSSAGILLIHRLGLLSSKEDSDKPLIISNYSQAKRIIQEEKNKELKKINELLEYFDENASI